MHNNRGRDDASNVTTLKLARGSIAAANNSTSPPMRGLTPGSSIMNPDSKFRSSAAQLLDCIPITEVLEHDERPTFILDVGNPANFAPGPLHILYANASLRAHEALYEVIKGKPDLASPGVVVTNDFPEFKQWAISFVANLESMDVTLPSITFGGMTWICSTLRKRLRIISAGLSGLPNAATSVSSNQGTNSSSLTERVGRSATLTTRANLSRTTLNEAAASTDTVTLDDMAKEPPDYFAQTADVNIEVLDEPDVASPINSAPLQMRSSNRRRVSPKRAMLAASQKDIQSQLENNSEMIGAGNASFDWTRIPLSAALPRHIQFARSIDWASTPLGPIENWDFDLRAMCNLIMASPMPCAMYWGPEYIAIYNEAYIMLGGQKHPSLMGQSYKTAWAEIWDEIEDVFEQAKNTAQSTCKEDDCLFIKRNGYIEETYFSWSIIPLIGEDGSVVGLYNPCFEKTRRKVAERRMLTLREVGEKTASARDIKCFWAQVIKGLEYNEYDVPFAMLYSCHDEDSDMSSMTSGSLSQAQACALEGSIGVPAGHATAVTPLDIKNSDVGWAPYLRETSSVNKPLLLSTEAGTLDTAMLHGLNPRGWEDTCRAVAIMPIHPTTGDTILGFLIIGINPRRPYDDDYSLFVQLLSRQLATAMASVVLYEAEIKRGERAARLAALDRQELSKQLDLRTQEAMESETKFTRIAEYAAVGLFIADPAGDINYCNDMFWSISRHPRTMDGENEWMKSVMDEDRPGLECVWKKLITEKTAVSHEFRFKTKWQDSNGCYADTWVMFSAYPERHWDGRLKSIFGCLTDISPVKLAEDLQKRRMEEAIENKRAQENFIDITSHEMRNPLSAILQSADEIITSLQHLDQETNLDDEFSETLHNCIDAAGTISLCGAHQKRIVDDILTLSKLDSQLLMVTPVLCQPVAVVQRALKMFEGELETKDIALGFQIEKSYLDLAVDWVRLDPSRLLQVLINLTTNAIKFTSDQATRCITVSVGAEVNKPSTASHSGVTYFPSRNTKRSAAMFHDKDWGTGEVLYLKFAVQDTGTGLDDAEKKVLFQRFSQASPRTHVTYGGSGLGLFISRELTELQGGEIGVCSEKGVGSTFAFHVKARRDESVSPDTPVANSIKLLRTQSPDGPCITLECKRNSNGKPISRGKMNRALIEHISPSRCSGPPTHAGFGHSEENSSTGKESSDNAPTYPTPPPAEVHILIVEDNLVNQSVLRRSLKRAGFHTHVANHGGEAIELLKTSRFWTGKETSGIELSIILMDLEMPVMDGLTCARRIRQLEEDRQITTHVPIIAVTANARMEQIETAISAGMDGVVSKPFRIPELTPKIVELVGRSRAGDWATTGSSSAATLPNRAHTLDPSRDVQGADLRIETAAGVLEHASRMDRGRS